MLRLIDLNINYSDEFQKGFQFGMWDHDDHLFYTDIEENSLIAFKNS